MRTAPLLITALLLASCSGGEGAKCAKDVDCGSGFVCFAPESPTIQAWIGAYGYDLLSTVVDPYTCATPDTVSGAGIEAIGREVDAKQARAKERATR